MASPRRDVAPATATRQEQQPGSSVLPDETSSAAPARAVTFRKFRELLMVKRFEDRDKLPVQVVPGLFIGSLGAASNREGLEAAGITHILSVAASLPLLFPDRFVCERLPLADLPTAPLLDVIPTGIAFIDRAIASGGQVLVHCFVGRSRSASMVIAYLMSRHGMTLDTAMELLKSVRPQVQPNSGFMAHLRTFESQLKDTNLNPR